MGKEGTRAQWVLRLAVAAEFAGHGVLATQQNPRWLHLFAPYGITAETAGELMVLIGVVDLVLAAHVLFRPVPAAVLYMVVWAAVTGLARPIAGASWLALVERGANIGAPLALLLLYGVPTTLAQWFLPLPRRGASSSDASRGETVS